MGIDCFYSFYVRRGYLSLLVLGSKLETDKIFF